MQNVQLRRGLDPRQSRTEQRAAAKLSIHCPCGTAVTGATKAGLGEAYYLHRITFHPQREAKS